jgi:tRNA threonylcarbamoyladenosine biosynthesis protein TsaB
VLVAALDSATLTLSCALVELTPGAPPRVRCERTDHAGKGAPGVTGGHGARLPAALTDLLGVEGLALPDVEGYAVGLGPGSFTGLRIGLATWKGLAYGNRRPAAGASSLMAMALAAAPEAGEGALLVPLLDARKGEVYAGFYRRAGQGVVRAAPDAALPPGDLAARLAVLGPGLAFGEGYTAYAAVLEGEIPRLATAVATPGAAAVAALATERLLGAPYDQQALFALEPHYVRKSEAEVKFPNGLGPGAAK